MSWLHKSVASSALEIIFDDGDVNVFFLYPTTVSPLEDGLGPTRTIDTVVEGTAFLTLASPKQVKGLQVSLVGMQTFSYRDKEHKHETLRRDLSLEIGDKEVLPAGRHAFRFSFLIPPNVAPSVWYEHGKTLYRIHAVAQGCGPFGSELRAEKKRIGFQVNKSGEKNGPPPSHSMVKEFLHQRFGPTRIEMSTKHLIIGGYLRWYIQWFDVLHPFTIENIIVDLIQTVQTKPSPSVTGPIETRVEKRRLYELAEDEKWRDQMRVTHYPGGPERFISRQFRIPFGAGPFVQASTHDMTETCKSFSHELKMQIIFLQYGNGEEKGQSGSKQPLGPPSRQALEVGCPANLSSCFCRLEYSKLPTYEESAAEALSNSAGSHNGTATGLNPAALAKTAYAKTGKTLPDSAGPMNVQCMCQETLQDEEVKQYGVPAAEVYRIWKEAQESRDRMTEMERLKAREQREAPESFASRASSHGPT